MTTAEILLLILYLIGALDFYGSAIDAAPDVPLPRSAILIMAAALSLTWPVMVTYRIIFAKKP
jgi:hypothetical protein